MPRQYPGRLPTTPFLSHLNDPAFILLGDYDASDPAYPFTGNGRLPGLYEQGRGLGH